MTILATTSADATPARANTLRLAAWAGAVAPILFAAIFTLDGLLKPGYSAYDEAISYLEVGAAGWVQQANFCLFGLLLLAFQVAYLRHLGSLLAPVGRRAAAALLVLSASGWIMAGLFIPNPYLAAQDSWHAWLHQIASITVFLPLAGASLVLGVQLVPARLAQLWLLLPDLWSIAGVLSAGNPGLSG